MCFQQIRQWLCKKLHCLPSHLVLPTPEKEKYWNNKYPKAVVMYKGRYIPNYGMYSVDVRSFLVNRHIDELERIAGKWRGLPHDEAALKCLRWVMEHIEYISDKKAYGLPEYWCYPMEVLHTGGGDCDDGAILLANLMEVAGIPYWKIRLTAGMVPEGGHAYVTYYYEEGDRWVVLDWCYYPSLKPVKERPDYKDSKIYREVWFSWNRKYAFYKRSTRAGNGLKELKCEVWT